MMLTKALVACALVGASAICAATFAQSQGEPAAAAASALDTVAKGDKDGAFVQPGRFHEQTGEALYRRVCAGCHMSKGEGAAGAGSYPALANNPKLAAGEYPIFVVLKGFNGMPPVGASMSDEQVVNVVNYIRTNFGNKFDNPLTVEDVAAAR